MPSIRRVLVALAALAFTTAASAASLSERSPFAQGHWWDSSRAGSGFDIFTAAGEAMLVWYTYEDSGRPVWYTAQGPLAGMGTAQWPLLKHRWQGGRKAGYDVVGWARPSINHPESLTLAWEVNGRQGVWDLKPFVVSGVVNEIDHTGSWFDPANSGWGLAITQQGDVLGGVLFTYDASGAPTWAAGFSREPASAQLSTFRGSCPACAYAPSVVQATGRLRFDFAGEALLTLRNELGIPMAAGIDADGARLVQLSRPVSVRPADRQLASIDSAEALKTYLAAGLFNVRASYGADFSPAPASAQFSTTNLQESGVDEADYVKSNGRLVYGLRRGVPGTAGTQPTIRVAAMGPEGTSFAMKGSVALATPVPNSMGEAGLYLHGERLVAVVGSYAYPYSGWSVSGSFMGATVSIEVMDTATADELPATRWRAQIQGFLVSTRRVGDRLYVVSRFVPTVQGFALGMGPTPANQSAVAWTPLADMLPKVSIDGAAPTQLLEASRIYMPPQGARTPIADMVVVTAIDLKSPAVAQSLAVLGHVDALYVSASNLYLTSSRWEMYSAYGVATTEPYAYVTDVHQVRLGSDAMTLAGSGSVEGYLDSSLEKAAFRMSEDGGRLRVVSSSATWWPASRNRLTILEPSPTRPGLLRTLAFLPNTQRPQTLGKPGEVLYATRFAGDRLYAVTFKLVDPLYVVDLSTPSDPRIAAAMELPGFSEYLHPLPNGLLLGFGKDAKPALDFGDGSFAWYQGLQLSLFDVRDLASPRELQRVVLGKRGSNSVLLRDHHGLSTLPQADGSTALAIPARIHDGPAPQYGGGDSAIYPWLESGLMRFELRGSTAADAHLVQMPSLITHRAPDTGSLADPAVTNGRSVLFTKGTVYFGEGRFWHRDGQGAVTGPF